MVLVKKHRTLSCTKNMEPKKHPVSTSQEVVSCSARMSGSSAHANSRSHQSLSNLRGARLETNCHDPKVWAENVWLWHLVSPSFNSAVEKCLVENLSKFCEARPAQSSFLHWWPHPSKTNFTAASDRLSPPSQHTLRSEWSSNWLVIFRGHIALKT